MSNIEEYKVFYKENPDICVFSSPWWLDAVAQGNWDVILVKENNQIVASFPYVYKKRHGKKVDIIMPPLTQKMGPYIKYGNRTKESKKIEFENVIYRKILASLPSFVNFNVSFDQKYSNWLAFCWEGFSQTTRYSYVIEDLSDIEKVKSGFAYAKRSLLKNSDRLTIIEDISKENFYDFFTEAINERNEKVTFDYSIFSRIYDAAYLIGNGKAYCCVDSEGNKQAIAFFVWDKKTAYYLLAMRKREYVSSGATELIIYEFLKKISGEIRSFDFEGSMIEGVEASYRRYGAVQSQYFSIMKNNNKIHHIIDVINNRLMK